MGQLDTEEVFAWLKAINDRHPPFDATKWVPLTERYRHLSIKFLFKVSLEEIYMLPTADEELEGGKQCF